MFIWALTLRRGAPNLRGRLALLQATLNERTVKSRISRAVSGERDGSVVIGERSFEIAFGVSSIGAVVECQTKTRIQFDGLVVVRNRAVEIAAGLFAEAAAVVHR